MAAPAYPSGSPSGLQDACGAVHANGARRRVPPAAASEQPALRTGESVYLRYLPSIYRQDSFIRRLLLIFESVLLPLEGLVDTLALYTEPELTPAEFLPWLAQWVGLALDASWPLDRQRTLIHDAAEIYRWRGTRHGLALHIQAYTGTTPHIQEYADGFVLGRDSALGRTTQLRQAVRDPLLVVVTVPVPAGATVDPAVLRAIIEEDKPAHVSYRLRLVSGTAAGKTAGPGDGHSDGAGDADRVPRAQG